MTCTKIASRVARVCVSMIAVSVCATATTQRSQLDRHLSDTTIPKSQWLFGMVDYATINANNNQYVKEHHHEIAADLIGLETAIIEKAKEDKQGTQTHHEKRRERLIGDLKVAQNNSRAQLRTRPTARHLSNSSTNISNYCSLGNGYTFSPPRWGNCSIVVSFAIVMCIFGAIVSLAVGRCIYRKGCCSRKQQSNIVTSAPFNYAPGNESPGDARNSPAWFQKPMAATHAAQL